MKDLLREGTAFYVLGKPKKLFEYLKRGNSRIRRDISYLQHVFRKNFDIVFITGMSGSGTSLLHNLLHQRYENAASVKTNHKMSDKSPFKMRRVDSYQTLMDFRKHFPIPDTLNDRKLCALYLNVYRKEMARQAFSYRKTSNVVLDKASILHQVRAKRLKTAFPQAKFLLIFRDPIMSIEGLRRKWQIYRHADLTELCDFWETLHREFVEDTSAFASDVMGIAYESLTQAVDTSLAEVAHFCGLKLREQLKPIKNHPNIPGKGLRNVINGTIQVVHEPTPCVFSLQNEELDFVNARLTPVYNELLNIYEKR